MFVLSRKEDQQVVAAGNIVITVVEIRGNTVRLGFEAPKEIAIDRYEVHLAKQAMQDNATGNGQQGGCIGEKSSQVEGNPDLMFPRSSLGQVG